jgi:pimeloyl-ACP methyl ester carboxylesterase
MQNLRMYGKPPFSVAVVHGGPGAAGEMAPVARELSIGYDVLEPLQTAASLDGQVAELTALLQEHGHLPVSLIGHSWGAMLSLLVASASPALVRRLLLVGCAPLEERYAGTILETRMSRLDDAEKGEALRLMKVLEAPYGQDSDVTWARLGALLAKADAFDPLPSPDETAEYRYWMVQAVWQEAYDFRLRGGFLETARRIRCSVVAIHGDYDPHPAEGVREPLSRAVRDFRYVPLRKCGHTPWLERQARERFYEVLRKELGMSSR